MKRRAYVAYPAALFLGLAIVLSPRPEGLTPEGQRALAVFAISVIFWTTHALPLAATSLLALVLLPLLGVMEMSKAFALFGNPAVFFILGAFILAAAMIQSGLSSRLALHFLRRFDRSPRRLVAGVLFTAASLAFFMPEHAVAALLFPIVLEIAHSLGLRRGHSNYGKALFLALAWGAVIGGVATLLGGARNALALAIMWDRYHMSISFLDWTRAVFPLVLVLWFMALGVILVGFPAGLRDVVRARVFLQEKVAALGPLSSVEWRVALVAVATIAGWIGLGHKVGLANISIAGAVALFVLRAVSWEQVEANVNWGVIVMYGGAVAMGSALAESGGARWVALRLLEHLHAGPLAILGLVALMALALTEAMSNSAVVAALLPVAYGLAGQLGLSPLGLTFAVAVPAGLAFCLPMGTPPNAIAYGAGYYRLRDSVMGGAVLGLTSWSLFLLLAHYWWPRVGISYVAP